MKTASQTTWKLGKVPRGLKQQYQQFFIPPTKGINRDFGSELDRLAPVKSVPSVVTYSVGEQPIMVGGFNA